MTKVNMNKEQFNIGQEDPAMPVWMKEARRNHGGMIAPEDFFTQFERKMNAVIDAQEGVNLVNSQKPGPMIRNQYRWLAAAAVALVIVCVSISVKLDWFGTGTIEQQGLLSDLSSVNDDDLDPTEDIYYSSLSDYEVYDLICGL